MSKVLINNHDQRVADRRLMARSMEEAIEPIELVHNRWTDAARKAAAAARKSGRSFKAGRTMAKSGQKVPKAAKSRSFRAGEVSTTRGAKAAGAAAAGGAIGGGAYAASKRRKRKQDS